MTDKAKAAPAKPETAAVDPAVANQIEAATLTPPFPATATGGPLLDVQPQPEVEPVDDDKPTGLPEGHSKKPKTYRATEAGTDWLQGIIMPGQVFTTTQPKGSWMEEVKLVD